MKLCGSVLSISMNLNSATSTSTSPFFSLHITSDPKSNITSNSAHSVNTFFIDSGMSSSAAMESCFAFGLNDIFGNNKVSQWDMVLAGQATEHNYCGVNCGIMDQFASVFGKAGCLMRLDCRSREFEYFPFKPDGYRLVLLDSVVKHQLAGSPYNDRRNSCENVVKHIQSKHPEGKFETLRDCTWEQLDEVRAEVGEEDYKRAKFVLGEKDRVLAVCDALNEGDYEKVGELMYQTHEGLSKDYEVSCE